MSREYEPSEAFKDAVEDHRDDEGNVDWVGVALVALDMREVPDHLRPIVFDLLQAWKRDRGIED